MSQIVHPTTLTLAASVIGLEVACFALVMATSAWRREKAPADLAMAVAAGLWLLHLLVLTVLVLIETQPALVLRAASVGAQGLTFGVAVLLMLSTRMESPRMWRALLVYAVAATAALCWHIFPMPDLLIPAHMTASQTWISINLLAIGLLAIAIAEAARQQPIYKNWLALAGALMGYALWIDVLSPHGPDASPITFTQTFYAAFLLIVWRLGKQAPDPRLETASSRLPPNSGLEPLSDFGPNQDVATAAIAGERRRIAQDLHDNIGSQIVNILASLDTRGSRVGDNLALSLEQCLLDLKMTVDSIDCVSDSVPEALGRLRQRVQHSLDVLGMRMVWRVQISEELEATRGALAEQVLRIAQECLANVMRHSRASIVEVACRYAPESRSIVLEIRDNGCGIPPKGGHAGLGKGLANMRRRAQAAGGLLVISSKIGAGTLARLTLPLAASPRR